MILLSKQLLLLKPLSDVPKYVNGDSFNSCLSFTGNACIVAVGVNFRLFCALNSHTHTYKRQSKPYKTAFCRFCGLFGFQYRRENFKTVNVFKLIFKLGVLLKKERKLKANKTLNKGHRVPPLLADY